MFENKNSNKNSNKSNNSNKNNNSMHKSVLNTELINLPGKGKNDCTEPTAYSLLWALVVFSFLGYVAEMGYQYHLNRKHESRKGVIYGPFSEIYGIGSIIAILGSQRLHNRNILNLFVFCTLFGGAYEYFASLFQETVFKNSAWNYEEEMLNIKGRTNLKFSLYWAIFGVIGIKYVYPLMCRQLAKLPHKTNLVLTWSVFLLISTDAFLSAAAMNRYRERHEKIPAVSRFQEFLDETYPDSIMKKIYPDMKFISG